MGRCRTYVAKVPAATNGIALGLCGFSGLWAKMGLIHQWNVDYIVIGALVVSACLYVTYIPIKLVSCFSVFREEMMQPPVVAAIASVPMTTMLFGTNVCIRADTRVGNIFVVAGGILQLLCMLHFFRLVYKQRAKPEPYWFPPTVSIAVTALAGKSCGWEPVIFQSCFYAALLIMIGILPFAFFRVHRHPNEVALGPTCNILCAPASLNSLVWHFVDQPSWPGPDNGWLGISLFGLAMCVWCSTLVALFLRRSYWVKFEFSPAWAAFTFPTASTSQAILYAYHFFLPDNLIGKVCHWVIFVGCNVVIMFVVVNFLRKMPGWSCALDAAPATIIDSKGSEFEISGTILGSVQSEQEYSARSLDPQLKSQAIPDVSHHVAYPCDPEKVQNLADQPVVLGYEIACRSRRRTHTISVGALERGLVPPTEYAARSLVEQRKEENTCPRKRFHSISVGALQAGHLPRSEQESANAVINTTLPSAPAAPSVTPIPATPAT